MPFPRPHLTLEGSFDQKKDHKEKAGEIPDGRRPAQLDTVLL